MKGRWGLAVLISIALCGSAQAQTAERSCLAASVSAALDESIAAITSRSPRTRWGILVERLGSREVLYAREAEQYFIPASNVKLLTTAAALTQLGADFRIRTSVYQTAGTLRVVGRGDPSFTDAQLQQLAQQIRARGITQIDRLFVDDSYFAGDAVNPGWEWEDVQAGYGAPVTSLTLNGNAMTLRLTPQAIGQPLRVTWSEPTGAQFWQIDNRSLTVAAGEPEFVHIARDLSRPLLRIRGQLQSRGEPDETTIAIPDPTQYFLRRFRQALLTAEISVRQVGVAQRSIESDAIELAAIESLPLSALLIPTNQDSENLYAESLLRQLGKQGSEAESAAILADSFAVLGIALTRLGVDPESYAVADGSGLSRHNLVSPEALVQTLQAMANNPIYRNSLAIAGESGTLTNRFRNTIVQGRLQGKTGALSGVAALSGYLAPPNAAPLVFSILVNHFDQPVREVRPAIDAIVLELARLQPCVASR
jgi:D-alanyl-D-alanine carboxypeptidase/D-alanyl-D-alanine-endopeptidase (penicillin-binding protein 4)